MTEKEKRDSGLLYSPDTDKELSNELICCKDKCFEYNNIRPSDIESKKKALKSIVGKTGGNFNVVSPFWCDYGYNITLDGVLAFGNPCRVYRKLALDEL